MMTTDPGDLVLDPTCGSGTTAFVAEQWGRRWITIDTSRVALALARARIMGGRYPWYLLADSPEGQKKEAEITQRAPSEAPTGGDIRQGFVYERVPHITLKSIANNAEIDVIWERWQKALEPLRARLNAALGKQWEEWEIPREAGEGWPADATAAHADWWEARIARQKAIDASIAAKADHEYLYDKPYVDNARTRVAGPFTVESLAPHRMLAVDENDELFSALADKKLGYGEAANFAEMILENLRTAGVQQAHKEDRIEFTSLTPWPGHYVCAEGRYVEGGGETGATRRAGVFIGPEFGTVARPDLVAAAREAAEAGFNVLIACAFQLRRPRRRVREVRRHPGAQGAHERRPPHGPATSRTPARATSSSSSASPISTSWRTAARPSGCGSTAWTSSTPTPARCGATAPTASPAGSSTPTTTRKASSCATPISSARTTPTRRSRRR